ncbi:MAG: hypothetical protein HY914_12285 [Desulfomonile tiedjei]|nr:hypothetical protein [Desulfomonile tiedjei]
MMQQQKWISIALNFIIQFDTINFSKGHTVLLLFRRLHLGEAGVEIAGFHKAVWWFLQIVYHKEGRSSRIAG